MSPAIRPHRFLHDFNNPSDSRQRRSRRERLAETRSVNIKDFGARRNFSVGTRSTRSTDCTRGANYLIKRFPVSRPSAFRGATKCSRNNCDVIHTLTMPGPRRESRCGCGRARRLIFQIQKVVPWGDKKQSAAAYTSITRSRREEIAPCAARKRGTSRSVGRPTSFVLGRTNVALCGVTRLWIIYVHRRSQILACGEIKADSRGDVEMYVRARCGRLRSKN